MSQLAPLEISNWIAIYLATGICCAIALTLSVGSVAIEMYRERAWTGITGVRSAILFVPRTWWRWQKRYFMSFPVTLGIATYFGLSLTWQ